MSESPWRRPFQSFCGSLNHFQTHLPGCKWVPGFRSEGWWNQVGSLIAAITSISTYFPLPRHDVELLREMLIANFAFVALLETQNGDAPFRKSLRAYLDEFGERFRKSLGGKPYEEMVRATDDDGNYYKAAPEGYSRFVRKSTGSSLSSAASSLFGLGSSKPTVEQWNISWKRRPLDFDWILWNKSAIGTQSIQQIALRFFYFKYFKFFLIQDIRIHHQSNRPHSGKSTSQNIENIVNSRWEWHSAHWQPAVSIFPLSKFFNTKCVPDFEKRFLKKKTKKNRNAIVDSQLLGVAFVNLRNNKCDTNHRAMLLNGWKTDKMLEIVLWKIIIITTKATTTSNN